MWASCAFVISSCKSSLLLSICSFQGWFVLSAGFCYFSLQSTSRSWPCVLKFDCHFWCNCFWGIWLAFCPKELNTSRDCWPGVSPPTIVLSSKTSAAAPRLSSTKAESSFVATFERFAGNIQSYYCLWLGHLFQSWQKSCYCSKWECYFPIFC